MRWDHLRLDGLTDSGPTEAGAGQGCTSGGAPGTASTAAGRRRDGGAEPGAGQPGGALFERGAVARTFDTPGFRGMTFYEIQAKSIVNRVPATSGWPSTGR